MNGIEARGEHPLYQFHRWGFGPVRGAYGPSGGHVKAFGFTYAWVEWPPHHAKWDWDFFGLFAIDKTIFKGETETRWAFGKLEISFRRARSRLYEATKERERRKYRRQRARGFKSGEV